jgi:hypothetical protein
MDEGESSAMNIHVIYHPVLKHFRKKRMKMFYEVLSITPKTRILDVGGSPFIWEVAAENGFPQLEQITLLNLFDLDKTKLPPNVRWVVGNGCSLPFEDGEFDVVFSNSVIEHLGGHDSQKCFANEIRRVGKSYWVQTPDPRFFVEPHYLFPFVHWFPVKLRRRIARLTPWGILMKPSDKEIEERVNEIRLIAPKEFRSLFPGAEIINERWIGMPKSLVARG